MTLLAMQQRWELSYLKLPGAEPLYAKQAELVVEFEPVSELRARRIYLQVELDPDQQQPAAYVGMSKFRLRMRALPLFRYQAGWLAAQDLSEMLEHAEGALLKLENYQIEGPA